METFEISTQECLKIINKFPKDNKLQFISHEILPLSAEPLGFLGEHSRLEITVNTPHINKKSVLKFFMKTLPSDTEAHKNYVMNIGVFKKEALLYKELFPKLQLCIEEPFLPASYLVSPTSFIVVEDLSLKGYVILKDKSQTLDIEHSKCLVKTLARFHVASIILEEQNSTKNAQFRLNEHYPDMLFESTFSYKKGHPRNDWLNTTSESLIQISKKLHVFQNINTEKPIRALVEEMKRYISPSQTYRNVINHGDLWSNNMMFNYSDTGVPKHCILVDYQMTRYVPPAFDFLTFLYLTTTEEFHQKYFLLLLDIYYSTFAAELKRHHLNPDKILRKDEFLESCEYYKPASLLESAMFGTIVYLNPDFSKDMLADPVKFDDFMLRDRSTLVCKQFDDDDIYRNRLQSVMIQLLNCIL